MAWGSQIDVVYFSVGQAMAMYALARADTLHPRRIRLGKQRVLFALAGMLSICLSHFNLLLIMLIIWCWFCTSLFWGSVLLYLRSPKGDRCSISDDLSCSYCDAQERSRHWWFCALRSPVSPNTSRDEAPSATLSPIAEGLSCPVVVSNCTRRCWLGNWTNELLT